MSWQLLLLITGLFLPAPRETDPGFTPGDRAHPDATPASAGVSIIDTVDFGRLSVGQSRDTIISIVINGGARKQIELDAPDPKQFLMTGSPIDTGGAVLVSIRFQPVAAGFAEARIRVIGTTQTDTSIVLLFGTADSGIVIATRLQLNEPWNQLRDTIDFGDTDVGTCDSAQLRIRNHTATPVEAIFNLFGPGSPAFMLRFAGDTIAPTTVLDTADNFFAIRFCPQQIGVMEGTVTIRTSHGTRTLFLRGRGVAPRIVVNPRLLTFPGSVECRYDTLVISNTGLRRLNVRVLISATGAANIQILDPKPPVDTVSVDSGATRRVILQFCGVDSVQALVTIESNDPANSVIEIPVRVGAVAFLTPTRFEFINDLPCETQTQSLLYIRDTSRPERLAVVRHGFVVGRNFTLDSTVLPISLGNQDSLHLRVTFCADTFDVDYYDTLYLTGNSGQVLTRIPLHGIRPSRSQLVIEPPSLNFGTVDTGFCRDLDLTIINRGNRSETISESSPLFQFISGGALAVASVQPGPMPRTLTPGDSMKVTIRYCPQRDDSLVADLAIMVGNSVRRVRLSGLGRIKEKPPVEEQTLWIDSTEASAGETLSLTVHLSPGIPPASPATNYSLRIEFDPRALYPIEAIDLSSKTALTFDRDTAGVMKLWHGGAEIVGDRLVELRFRGLSSGRDSNWVTFIEGKIDSVQPIRAGAPGLVRLFGCDIGRPTSLDRRASIRTISVDGSEAVLRFTAPEGSIAHLRLTSTAGDLVSTIELPPATGAEQTVPINLGGIAPGFYILELRVGDGRSSVPLMIAR